MAQIPDLTPTDDLNATDQAIIRQGNVDKRISLTLATYLAWAIRNNYTYLGAHEGGSVTFTNRNQFSVYLGRIYFPKADTSLPYSPTVGTNAETDSKVEVYRDAIAVNIKNNMARLESKINQHTRKVQDPSKVSDTNPHGTTKFTIGLGKIQNYDIADGINQDRSDLYASSKAVYLAMVERNKTETKVNSHINKVADRNKVSPTNPHGITKATVELGNVRNYSFYDGVDSDSSTTYASARSVKVAYQKGVQAKTRADDAYNEATSITKGKVGLGSVNDGGWSDSYDLDSGSTYATSKAVHDLKDWVARTYRTSGSSDSRYYERGLANRTFLGINGKAKDSTKADYATRAGYASSAGNADTVDGLHASAFLPVKGKAENSKAADYATRAGSATNSTNASRATNADNLGGRAASGYLKTSGGTLGGTLYCNSTLSMETNDVIQLGRGSSRSHLFNNNSHTYWDFYNDRDLIMRDRHGTTYESFRFYHGNGNFRARGDIIAFSDERVKTDREIIKGALSKVKQLDGMTYKRTDMESTKRSVGLLAQQVEKVLPEAVSTFRNESLDIDDFKAVSYGNMVALLVEAVKELSDKVDNIK